MLMNPRFCKVGRKNRRLRLRPTKRFYAKMEKSTVKVFKDTYKDSIELMRLSSELKNIKGVKNAAVMMGTEANLDLMKNAGLLSGGTKASGSDLVLSVDAESGEAVEQVMDFVSKKLSDVASHMDDGGGEGGGGGGGSPSWMQPKTLQEGFAKLKGANFALVSTPGPFATAEAQKALQLGLHVFMFSDNVDIADETKLKLLAQKKNLLVMGPDCGTAIIDGIPFAFANQVRHGNIGLVSASGTGSQQVSCLIDKFGGGVSQIFGTGGRDLKEDVGGITTLMAFEMLEKDPGTDIIVIISKGSPGPTVEAKLCEKISDCEKPVVVVLLGSVPEKLAEAGAHVAVTLEDAATLATQLNEGGNTEIFPDPNAVPQPANEKTPLKKQQQKLVGLFAGGTHMSEAKVVFKELQKAKEFKDLSIEVLDLGDDEYCVGKPHPMIDYSTRNSFILKYAAEPDTAVILIDVVLGFGSHPNPAGELLPVLNEIKKKYPQVLLVGHVCGTAADFQNLADQEKALKDAGLILLPTNARAARVAAQIACRRTPNMSSELLQGKTAKKGRRKSADKKTDDKKSDDKKKPAEKKLSDVMPPDDKKSDKKPAAADTKKSGGDDKKAGGDNKQSGGDDKKPAAAGDDKKSGGDDKKPAGDDKQSGGDGKPSDGDSKPSGSDSKPSGGDEHKSSEPKEGKMFGDIAVINVGLKTFTEPIQAAGAQVLHLDWKPPAKGDREGGLKLADLLPGGGVKKGDFVEEANKHALEKLKAGQPMLLDFRPAREVIPNFDGKILLHAGPPIEYKDMCGPMKGAIIGAIVFEGWAPDLKEAEKMAGSGKVKYAPCHHFNAVGPMTGVMGPSFPVCVVQNGDEITAFSTLNEGLGKVLRMGANSEPVLEKLKWMRDELGPTLSAALKLGGPMDLRAIMQQAIAMGDEVHNRNVAATSLFTRAIAPHLSRAAATDVNVRVFEFLRGNDHFFLNLSMAACKSMTQAAHNIKGSTICTVMCRNGVDFGIRLSGAGDQWFTAPAAIINGLFFPGYSEKDANPDIGDSSITETYGIGGFSMAAAPAIVRFVGGTAADAKKNTLQMYRITNSRNGNFAIPNLDFDGAPLGLDARKVVDSLIQPVINTGIAHKVAGIGQVGAGIAHAPLEPFVEGIKFIWKKLEDI